MGLKFSTSDFDTEALMAFLEREVNPRCSSESKVAENLQAESFQGPGHMDKNAGCENWKDFSLGLAGVCGWFLWDRNDLPIILGNTETECPQPRLNKVAIRGAPTCLHTPLQTPNLERTRPGPRLCACALGHPRTAWF